MRRVEGRGPADRARRTGARLRSARSGFRPASGVLAIIAVIAAATVLPTAMSGDVSPVSAAATSPVQAGAARLFLAYSQKSALIGGTWWQGAVALSTLETYQQATGDAEYSSVIRPRSPAPVGRFENQADDDTSWWGLAWLQAYDITRSRQYLSMAETDADYVHEDWDSTCGGGIWWQRNPPPTRTRSPTSSSWN